MLEHPEKTSGLDALRGIMALVVCFSHGLIILGPVVWRTAQDISAVAARVAVIVFFAISGFVISLSIKRNQQKNSTFSILEYASARAFRILPPLLLCYLLVWLVAFGIPARHADWLAPVTSFVTLAARGGLTAGLDDPLWTLQQEIQLYVIAGLLALALSSRKRWPLFVAAIYAIACFRPWIDGHLTFQAAFYIAFLAGWAVNRCNVTFRRYLSLLCFGVAAAIFCSYPLSWSAANLSYETPILVSQMFFAWGCALLLPDLGCWETRLRSMGAYSYTLYIIHFPIMMLIAAHVGRSALVATAGVLVAWLLSAWVGPMIERPKEQKKAVVALLHRLRRRPRAADASSGV